MFVQHLPQADPLTICLLLETKHCCFLFDKIVVWFVSLQLKKHHAQEFSVMKYV